MCQKTVPEKSLHFIVVISEIRLQNCGSQSSQLIRNNNKKKHMLFVKVIKQNISFKLSQEAIK